MAGPNQRNLTSNQPDRLYCSLCVKDVAADVLKHLLSATGTP